MPQYTDVVSFPAAQVWDDMLGLYLSPTSSGPSTPTSINFGPSGTMRALSFGVGDQINGQIQFSHSYKEGSLISPHIHWTPVDTNTGNVNFQLTYYWFNVGQAAVGIATGCNAVPECRADLASARK